MGVIAPVVLVEACAKDRNAEDHARDHNRAEPHLLRDGPTPQNDQETHKAKQAEAHGDVDCLVNSEEGGVEADLLLVLIALHTGAFH